jgi:formylglycine-generating enzyme required for sulfatase activity
VNAQDIQKAMRAEAKEIEIRALGAAFTLVRIPPGEFDMGSPPDEVGHRPNEGPVLHVRISQAFYLGRYEVTQAQYEAVMKERPSLFQGASLAVDQILYRNALEFCRRLSQASDVDVTLPTEAQWEYACRAGTTTPFFSGKTPKDLDDVAWYAANSGRTTHPVGLKKPNAWGLYDMHGNVWEMCADFFPSFDMIGAVDPRGVVSDQRGAIRGGAWMQVPEDCRAARRMLSHDMFGGSGIRIAVNPKL